MRVSVFQRLLFRSSPAGSVHSAQHAPLCHRPGVGAKQGREVQPPSGRAPLQGRRELGAQCE